MFKCQADCLWIVISGSAKGMNCVVEFAGFIFSFQGINMPVYDTEAASVILYS